MLLPSRIGKAYCPFVYHKQILNGKLFHTPRLSTKKDLSKARQLASACIESAIRLWMMGELEQSGTVLGRWGSIRLRTRAPSGPAASAIIDPTPVLFE
jgi:hypothetical protein